MVWREDRGIRCSDGVNRHPYEAYDPKYGWHMAVRIEGDETIGRALCMTSPTGRQEVLRQDVRYGHRATAGTVRQTTAWRTGFAEQGYHKRCDWQEGERLAYHETSDHFLAPYLDGGEKRVTIDAGNRCVVIDSDGEYVCDQTGGCPTDDSGDFFDCEDCGDRTDDNDGYWIGRGEDTRVCESCLNTATSMCTADVAISTMCIRTMRCMSSLNSEHYDEDYLDDNEIVELNNGEYAPMDEASRDQW
jgi:hypothetical protein